jgi:hypothetical protein
MCSREYRGVGVCPISPSVMSDQHATMHDQYQEMITLGEVEQAWSISSQQRQWSSRCPVMLALQKLYMSDDKLS